MTTLLSSTFFGPVQWYQKLARSSKVLIEQHDAYQKQTYRNRCLIATTNGVQALTVPVTVEMGRALISDHGNWRHQHWQALTSAYGDSPFFLYYEDDLRPFFTERWEYLYDFNEAIRQKMCELIDIHPNLSFTTDYVKCGDTENDVLDLREAIQPKHPIADSEFTPQRYYQVYERKHGFLANLSILDLLCNMGPESVFLLQ
jgi:hypothetical protein